MRRRPCYDFAEGATASLRVLRNEISRACEDVAATSFEPDLQLVPAWNDRGFGVIRHEIPCAHVGQGFEEERPYARRLIGDPAAPAGRLGDRHQHVISPRGREGARR